MASSQNNHSGKSKKNITLDAEYLTQQLSQYAQQHNIKTWCLAYSGGVDSQVLLHLLHATKFTVSAVYIDHGLQAQSADWAEHCRQQCAQLNIPFQKIIVNAQATKGESPEAAARTARYMALKKIIKVDSCLLTAQHQDDQSETVLLQLLRGGGAAGLAGMPDITEFSVGWHARPLLQVSQNKILDYAKKNNLSWVEDPSNQHENFDRNYLRHSVIPKISERWPALNKTLSAFSKQQAENAQLLDELAELDLQTSLFEIDCLDINFLKKYDDARLRNILRLWLKKNNSLVPSRAVLAQVVQQLNTSHDTAALVGWATTEVRRFRDRLYCLKKSDHDATQVYSWDSTTVLSLASIHKKLHLKNMQKNSQHTSFVLKASIADEVLTVRYRQGGEKIKPAGRTGTHDLKSLFQEAAIPTWQRDKIPLLFMGDELIAVVGYWLADEFSVKGEGVLPVLIASEYYES